MKAPSRTARLGVVVAGALAACVACDGRTPAGGRGRVAAFAHRDGAALAVFDLSAGVPETDPPGLLGLSPRRASFDALVAALDDLRRDKDDRGAFVRFGAVSLGLARSEELGEALARVRATGKVVHCHAETLTNATLFAAARGCGRISVSPAGEVDSVGLAAQVVYMRKLLVDELKLSVDILQVGRFKGAEEPLTRDGPSDEARESLEGTLADLRRSWLDGIQGGRSGGDAVVAAEDGPHSPEKAVSRGLVDAVAYADEARDAVKKAVGASREAVRFGPGAGSDGGEWSTLVRALAGEGNESAPVALVRAVGAISMSGGGGPFGGSGGITEHEMARALARIEKDDAVKAVVLRIDSPGGSALASDLIWHDLMKVRKTKPIVVSVGDMAASGGYYLASAGTEIFAESTSIVGSIGVVGGKVGVGTALDRFGVHAETFAAKRGDEGAAHRAAYLSTFTPWDPATRSRVLESMRGVYDLFVHRVAEGRKLPPEEVARWAEGRIFSGREGKGRGMVDQLGGLGAAIARAKELAHLPEGAAVGVFGQRPGLLEALTGGGDADEDATGGERGGARLLLTGAAPAAGKAVAAAVQALAPEVVPFAESFGPLLAGEERILALPFALGVR